jgi:hypothetical protein
MGHGSADPELKIRELRSFAERELGPKFDLRAFHDSLLGHGQLPLDLLEMSIKAWIDEKMAPAEPLHSTSAPSHLSGERRPL